MEQTPRATSLLGSKPSLLWYNWMGGKTTVGFVPLRESAQGLDRAQNFSKIYRTPWLSGTSLFAGQISALGSFHKFRTYLYSWNFVLVEGEKKSLTSVLCCIFQRRSVDLAWGLEWRSGEVLRPQLISNYWNRKVLPTRLRHTQTNTHPNYTHTIFWILIIYLQATQIQ